MGKNKEVKQEMKLWRDDFGLTMNVMIPTHWCIVQKDKVHIKFTSKEAKELFGAIQDAVEDGEVTPKELTNIIKEARDVKDAALSIAKLIARK